MFLTDDGAAENGDPIPSEADEELFHSLLAKAGMHLASAEGDESLVHLDAEALQVGVKGVRTLCTACCVPDCLYELLATTLTQFCADLIHRNVNSLTQSGTQHFLYIFGINCCYQHLHECVL